MRHARQLHAPLEVLRLRREYHERAPSSSTYSALKSAVGALDAWERERDAARATLRAEDQRGYLHALLGDGDNDHAWHAATAAPPDTWDADLWLALAERREATDPADAVAVYLRSQTTSSSRPTAGPTRTRFASSSERGPRHRPPVNSNSTRSPRTSGAGAGTRAQHAMVWLAVPRLGGCPYTRPLARLAGYSSTAAANRGGAPP